MREFVGWMNGLPESALYAILWIGAALENFVPAIPADTFVALGGFLAGAGIAGLEPIWVFLGTWLFNVGGALTIYRLSHRYGRPFFEDGLGRHLLRPHQMGRVSTFYDRWGTPAIFLSRFLPGIRAVVPVFAGITHQGWTRVVLPIAVASALWYGGLVYLGMLAGRNLALLERLLGSLNRWLALAALVVAVAAGLWWLRTRHPPDDDASGTDR
ncbi:MAG: DedA family protein [Longimicrobiales bacterium]|nr:DedA family protein [Longimicrobiales bacterium]